VAIYLYFISTENNGSSWDFYKISVIRLAISIAQSSFFVRYF